MRLRDLIAFQWGRREAIERIAGARGSVWVAVLLVFSAALARDYDGTNILARPWELLIPLGVSWFTASCLFFLIVAIFVRSEPTGSVPAPRYLAFLTLFWMTAPHAWLYGIPYERFLSEYDATRANLWTLALVSIWRVLLITRVASVLFGFRFRVVIWAVLWLSDTVLVAFAIAAPKPVIAIMGGVHYSETERLILDVMLSIIFFGTLAWPVLAAITLGVKFSARPVAVVEPLPTYGPPAWAVWAVVIVALAGWTAAAVSVRPEQALRARVEARFAAADYAAAAALLAGHPRDAFPPQWQPPTSTSPYAVDKASLELLHRLNDYPDGAAWPRRAYADRLRRQIKRIHWMGQDDFAVLAEWLPRLPEGPALAEPIGAWLAEDNYQAWSYFDEDERVPLRTLLHLAGLEPPETHPGGDSEAGDLPYNPAPLPESPESFPLTPPPATP